MSAEFDLIREYFAAATPQRADVLLGIGDDCALLEVPPGMVLAVSMDTLVSGRHFFPEVNPASLGHKALAVNLSDLAAMGATPAWVTLGLTLPDASASWRAWLNGFMQGMTALANQYQVQLVGGDTTRGPLSMTLQIHGFVPAGKALRRSGAKAGDQVYVSGTLGDAGLALQLIQTPEHTALDMALTNRLERPSPRVALGQALLPLASAAIDISDGLAADLGHLSAASGCAAKIELDRLPLSSAVRQHVERNADWRLPLTAGDDYELVFTVPAAYGDDLEQAALDWDVSITQIGVMQAGQGVHFYLPDRSRLDLTLGAGYDHFTKT